MKCIQYYPSKSGDRRIERVSDVDANMVVKVGLAFYVTRSVWKKEVRDALHSN